MSRYICPRCEKHGDAKDGDAIPALDGDWLVCEECATYEEVRAYLGEGWR